MQNGKIQNGKIVYYFGTQAAVAHAGDYKGSSYLSQVRLMTR